VDPQPKRSDVAMNEEEELPFADDEFEQAAAPIPVTPNTTPVVADKSPAEPQPDPPPTLQEQLLASLDNVSSGIVDEVYNLSKRFVDDERARQGRLDAKATSLLTVVGLSLTVAFNFGGQLLTGGPLKGVPHKIAAGAFCAALLAGFVAAIFALATLLVKGGAPGMDRGAVFNVAGFARLAELKTTENKDDVAGYKASVAAHLWRMGDLNRTLQSRKATLVKIGQVSFGVFLVALLVVFVALGYAALTSHAGP
jgi:hypothetical protein